jgi:uncharacterized protein YihD (DUF1040 family)
MHQWLKRTVLVCGIFIAVWLGMATYWNANNRLPTSADVVVSLGLLPTGLILVIWLFARIFAELVTKPASNISITDSQQVDKSIAAAENEDIRTELVILSSSIRAAHGQSVDELAQVLGSNKARPVLDEELTDLNGYPVLSGRVPAVDEEAQRKTLTDWMATHQFPEINWCSEQIRALDLGSAVLLDLLQQVVTHPLLPAYIASPPAQRPLIALPILQLHSILPRHWNEEQQHIASEWFKYLLEQQGWPAERISVSQAISVDHPQPFLMIEQLSLQTLHQASPCFALLIACSSHIGDQSVLEWEQGGKLLTGSTETGQIPSEGAAGFLFADARQANLMKVEVAAKIHRPISARREKSADARGRINADTLSELARKALASATIQAEQLGFLTADTDHRPNRASELIEMTYTTLPDLDLKTQCYKVAAACGFAGAVSSLTALALAHHAVVTDGSSALCISNLDEFECSAVAISPVPDDTASLTVPA